MNDQHTPVTPDPIPNPDLPVVSLWLKPITQAAPCVDCAIVGRRAEEATYTIEDYYDIRGIVALQSQFTREEVVKLARKRQIVNQAQVEPECYAFLPFCRRCAGTFLAAVFRGDTYVPYFLDREDRESTCLFFRRLYDPKTMRFAFLPDMTLQAALRELQTPGHTLDKTFPPEIDT